MICNLALLTYVDIFFSKFKDTLEAYMKQCKATGAYEKKKANTISEEIEDILWENRLLGNSNPQVLLDMMVYYLEYYFVIRSGTMLSLLSLTVNSC